MAPPLAGRPQHTVTIHLPMGWHNQHIWGNHIPMCMLPFFVFLTAQHVAGLEAFENFESNYQKFIATFQIKHTPEFKEFCAEINTHYYECNH